MPQLEKDAKLELDGEVFYIALMLDGCDEKTENTTEACTLLISKNPEGSGTQRYWSIPIIKGSLDQGAIH